MLWWPLLRFVFLSILAEIFVILGITFFLVFFYSFLVLILFLLLLSFFIMYYFDNK